MFGIFPQFEDWYSSVTVYRFIVYLQGIRLSTVRLNASDTQYNVANSKQYFIGLALKGSPLFAA